MNNPTNNQDNQETKRVKKEIYSIDKILAVRNDIVREVAFHHEDKVCEGEDFESLVDAFVAFLPNTVMRDVVYDSILEVAGEKMTKDRIRQVAWRLAGNLPRLSKGIVVPPWTRQQNLEWVPAQIVAARRRKGNKGDMGWLFTFQVLAGSPCPSQIQKFWTDKFCHFLKPHLGFAKYVKDNGSSIPKNVFQHPLEFVTMRLLLLIDPKLSDVGPSFDKVDMVPSLLEWNHEQMRYRDRLEPGFGCPRGYDLRTSCWQCHVGYVNCRAGTHKYDFEIEPCESCGETRAVFDYDVSEVMCLNCYERKAFERR